jgi:hypothetical protein
MRARAVVLAMAIGFVAQVAFVAVAEEPYPALMMPRFGWAGPTDAMTIPIPSNEITFSYADSTTRTITQHDLLAGLPDGHHTTIMNSILSPLPKAPPTRRAPPDKREPPIWLFPGYRLAAVTRTRPESVRSLRRWLSQRAQAFYAGAVPVSCTVDWYVENYLYDATTETGADSVPTRTRTGRFEMDLNVDATTPD